MLYLSENKFTFAKLFRAEGLLGFVLHRRWINTGIRQWRVFIRVAKIQQKSFLNYLFVSIPWAKNLRNLRYLIYQNGSE